MAKLRHPKLVVAADWSKNEKKRWMCRAERNGKGRYFVYPPEPVGDHKSLFHRLQQQVGSSDTVLVGFDFPIGLPVKFAAQAKLPDFRTALGEFGKGRWRDFYEVSDDPTLEQPFYPKPKGKGQKGNYKTQLAVALGCQSLAELRRRCDAKTDTRTAAECLFYTLGGQQVGAGAIVGWSEVIAPAAETISIWPFDESLSELLSKPGIVAAEIYPGEAYSHLGIRIGSGTGRSKRSRSDRQAVSGGFLALDRIHISNAAKSWIEWGFLYEDDFDAMVGLLSMLLVVTGQRCANAPESEDVRSIEGWILGQAVGNEGASLRPAR